MKNKSILFLLSLIAGSVCFAQEQGVILKMPDKYLLPSDHIQPPTPEDELSESSWIVFSDHSHNPVYNQPNGNQIVFMADFLDAFYVKDLHGEWLKLESIEKKNQKKPLVGWMKHKDLLLWHHCLVVNNSNLPQVVFLKKPYYTNSFESSELLLIQNINKLLNPSFPLPLFKYKTQGDSVLIGYERYIKPNDNFALQWVPIETVFEWKNNLVLEPNINPESILQRRTIVGHDTIGLILLDSYNNAQDYSEGRISKTEAIRNKFAIYTENPIVTKRHPGLINRFIVLDTMNEKNYYPKILKVGVFQLKEAIVTKASERNFTDFFLDEGYAVIDRNNDSLSDFSVSLMINNHKIHDIINMYKDFVTAKQYPASMKRHRLISGIERWSNFVNQYSDRIIVEIGDIFLYHGIPIDDTFYHLKLADLYDPKVIDDEILDELLGYFDQVLDRLTDIYSNRLRYPRLVSLKSDNLELFIPAETFSSQ